MSLVTFIFVVSLYIASISDSLAQPNTVLTSAQCSKARFVIYDATSATVFAACGIRIHSDTPKVSVSATAKRLTMNNVSFAFGQWAVFLGAGVVSETNGVVATLVSSKQCSPASLFYDAESATLFVACDVGIISVQGGTVTALTTSTQCSDAVSVFYDADSATVFAACGDLLAVNSIISIHAGTVTPLISSTKCGAPLAVVYDGPSATLFAACNGDSPTLGGNGGVLRLHGSAVTVLTSPSLCPAPMSVFYDAGSATVFATCLHYATYSLDVVISIHDTTVKTLVTSVCSWPSSVTYDAATGIVFAACSLGGVLSIQGTAVATVISSVQCSIPISIFYDAASQTLFAACVNSGVVGVQLSSSSSSSSSLSSSSSSISNISAGVIVAIVIGVVVVGLLVIMCVFIALKHGHSTANVMPTPGNRIQVLPL